MEKGRVLRSFCGLVLVAVMSARAGAPVRPSDPLSESGRTVVVGYYSEPGLMNGAEEGAVKSGYAYECLQEIASHAGWRYRYVFGTFKELYDRLRAGEIDLLPYVTRTAAREKEVLFPKMEMGSEHFYLAAKNGDPLDESLAGLQGRKVGTNKAAFHLEPFAALLKEKGVTCELVVSTNPEDRWKALMRGECDFSIETSTVMQDVPLKAVYAFGEDYPYYFAVAPGRKDILGELDAAQRRTLEISPAFLHRLRQKYFGGISLFRMLPEQSVAWLKQHRVIRIGSYDRQAPYVYERPGGGVEGIMPDGVRLMLREIGVTNPVEWKFYSGRPEALAALRAGEIDLINPYYHNYADAERDGVIISAPVYATNFGILYRGDYDLNTLAVVATPGTRLGIRYMRDNYPHARCIGCRDAYDCIEKLLGGQVNSVVMYLPTLQRTAGEYGEDFSLKVMSTPCDVCFAALPKNAALIGAVNKALPYIDAIALNEIENRHAVAERTHVGIGRFFRQNVLWFYAASVLILLVGFVIVILWVFSLREREKREVAEKAGRAKSEFLFNMSHDIRTPMHAIVGFADIAAQNIDDRENVRDCIVKIRQAGDLLFSLLNSILDLSRLEAGKMKPVESVFDVRHSFDGLNSTMTEIAKEKNISLSFSYGNVRDRYVYADQEKADRIFMNILSNAVKYTKEGGRIRARCEQVDAEPARPAGHEAACRPDRVAWYRYTFEDNGIGMSPEFVARLYERFSREMNTTMSGVSGIGLGMSICKAFVDLLGGTIECDSRKGVGTTFVVTLPFRIQEGEKYYLDPLTGAKLKVEDGNGEGAAREDGSGTEHGLPDVRGRRVLLVEDSKLNREVSRYSLEKAGMEVETAADGAAAVDLVRAKGPGYYDVIFMDIQMPGMGGYEAAGRIREWERANGGNAGRPGASRVPIVAWSANAFEEDREKSLAAGMDDHIAKGVKTAVLLECIGRHLSAAGGRKGRG